MPTCTQRRPFTRFLSTIVLALSSLAGAAYATDTMRPLNLLGDHTLFGVTVESGSVWSVYLDRTGQAYFTYATGKTGTADWHAPADDVICFAFEQGGAVCKRGHDYGIGRGWATVHPNGDGTWRYDQEDIYGTSRIFAARPGRQQHDPASWKGDLGASVPGRVLIDNLGIGVYAIDLRADGSGAYVDARGSQQVKSTGHGADYLCLDDACADIRIEGGRIKLFNRENGRFEGYIVYLAPGWQGAATPPVTHHDNVANVALPLYPGRGLGDQEAKAARLELITSGDSVLVSHAGKVVTPDFTPATAEIAASSENFVLLRFTGPMLPEGCPEAYRWAALNDRNRIVLSEAFGSCKTAHNVTVEWEKARLLVTVFHQDGPLSVFLSVAYGLANETGERRRPATVSGPSVKIDLPPERSMAQVEAERQAQEQEAQRQKERQARKDQRAATLAAARQPGKPTGQLKGGNLLDLLAQPGVRDAIRRSDEGEKGLDLLDTLLETVTRLPPIIEKNGIRLGGACGKDGCDTRVLTMLDSKAGKSFTIILAGYSAAQFGDMEHFARPEFSEALDEMVNLLRPL